MGVIIIIFFVGCAFGRTNSEREKKRTKSVKLFDFKELQGYFIIIPEDLKSNKKSEIIKKLGVPDSIVREGIFEHWCYEKKATWYIYFPSLIPDSSGGVFQAKNLQLIFKKDRVDSVSLYDKGLSWGIAIPQGSVGN